MNEAESKEVAGRFADLLGTETKVGNSSIFAGSLIEVMKTPYLGACGHIAIATTNVDRAVYHLERRGYKFNMETAKYDADGRMTVVYLEGEIGGFAIHLVNR